MLWIILKYTSSELIYIYFKFRKQVLNYNASSMPHNISQQQIEMFEIKFWKFVFFQQLFRTGC